MCSRAVSTPATHSSFEAQQSVIAQWATKVGNPPTISTSSCPIADTPTMLRPLSGGGPPGRAREAHDWADPEEADLVNLNAPPGRRAYAYPRAS